MPPDTFVSSPSLATLALYGRIPFACYRGGHFYDFVFYILYFETVDRKTTRTKAVLGSRLCFLVEVSHWKETMHCATNTPHSSLELT
jgi:hypothetical protein